MGGYTDAEGGGWTATDVWFRANLAQTVPTGGVEVPAEIAALPDHDGAGTVRSLRESMALDATLAGLVGQFTAEATAAGRDGLIEAIVLRWTGAEDAAPDGRGGNVDGRHLAALEALGGREFRQLGTEPNPRPQAGAELEQTYGTIREHLYASLMAQSHLAAPFGTLRTYGFAIGLPLVAMEFIIDGGGAESLSEFARTFVQFRDILTLFSPDVAAALSDAGGERRCRPWHP